MDVRMIEREHKSGLDEALDAALYIAALADELTQLAKRHHLDALAYLLEMARMEAHEVAKARTGRTNLTVG